MGVFYDYRKGDKVRPRAGRKSSNDLNFEGITAIKVVTSVIFASECNRWMYVSFTRKGKIGRYYSTIYAGAIEPDTEEQVGDDRYDLTF